MPPISAICRKPTPSASTFHKTGFAPYISSLVLVRNSEDLRLVTRSAEQMPYLYHFGEHRPGMYTLETSRAGTGPLAALANFRLFGEHGPAGRVVGHIVEMAQLLREHLEGHEGTTVLNRDNFGTRDPVAAPILRVSTPLPSNGRNSPTRPIGKPC